MKGSGLGRRLVPPAEPMLWMPEVSDQHLESEARGVGGGGPELSFSVFPTKTESLEKR